MINLKAGKNIRQGIKFAQNKKTSSKRIAQYLFRLFLMILKTFRSQNYPKLAPIRRILYEKKSEIFKNFFKKFLKSVQIIFIFNLAHFKKFSF